MDLIKQALSISDDKKLQAKMVYEMAVIKLVRKDSELVDDPHLELSGIFAELWMPLNRKDDFFNLDPHLYAESNVAFNYANCVLGARGKFVPLAKRLVDEENRLSNKDLEHYGSSMDCLVTATTPEHFRSVLPQLFSFRR